MPARACQWQRDIKRYLLNISEASRIHAHMRSGAFLELSESARQHSDPKFAGALSRARVAEAIEEDAAYLNQRHSPFDILWNINDNGELLPCSLQKMLTQALGIEH